YNIARARTTTPLEVVAALNALLGTSLEAVPGGPPLGPQHGLADVSRAEAELGFCASIDLEQGLRRCLAEFMPQGEGADRLWKPHGSEAKSPYFHNVGEPAPTVSATAPPDPEPGYGPEP